ncbi:MAG: hypothetical protein JOZ57_06000 [Abitibacteriaceae bacterium]|nr:hypothetical protein [Abditibacteriaceae bacterium]
MILPVTNRQTSVPKDLQPVALASLADNIQRYPYAKVFSVEWGSYSHFYDCDDHVLRYVYDRDQGTFMYDDIVSAERKCCAEHQVYEGVADSAVLQVAHKRGTHLQLSHYGGKLNPRLSQALHSCCMSRAVINSELQRHNQVMQRLRSGSP